MAIVFPVQRKERGVPREKTELPSCELGCTVCAGPNVLKSMGRIGTFGLAYLGLEQMMMISHVPM